VFYRRGDFRGTAPSLAKAWALEKKVVACSSRPGGFETAKALNGPSKLRQPGLISFQRCLVLLCDGTEHQRSHRARVRACFPRVLTSAPRW
jgi:hypothetical protein